MKRNYLLCIAALFASVYTIACPVCDEQQPSITQGLTHGAGPESNWDWVIIAVVFLITLFTLWYSIKYLVKPEETEVNHIKKTILN